MLTRRVKVAVPLKYLDTIFGELFKCVVNKICNKRYETLCYFFCKKESKILNKRYETLCYFFCKKENKICNKKIRNFMFKSSQLEQLDFKRTNNWNKC